jgi:hypothetical protein
LDSDSLRLLRAVARDVRKSPHLRAKAGVDDRIGVAAREMQAAKQRSAGVVKSRRVP